MSNTIDQYKDEDPIHVLNTIDQYKDEAHPCVKNY